MGQDEGPDPPNPSLQASEQLPGPGASQGSVHTLPAPGAPAGQSLPSGQALLSHSETQSREARMRGFSWGVGVARAVLGPSLGSETGKHTEDFRVSVPAKQDSS